MLTLKHYELLVVLAEELHFGHAAVRLNISQPQLTLQLQQMEEVVGAVLFDRNRRRVRIAPAGALILPEARAVLRQARRAEDIALRAGRGMMGELALGYIGAAAFNGVLTQLVRGYRARAPETVLTLRLMDLDQQIPEIAAGNLDAGIVRLPYPDMPENVASRTLCEESLWIALPSDHPLAGEKRVALSELSRDPFVATHLPPQTGFSAAMHTACAVAGITPNIVQRSPQFASIVSLVAAGLGVAIVPEAIRNIQMSGVVYRPLVETGVTANISLVYRADSESRPLHLLLSCLDGSDPVEGD
ncbi:LysR family transcriptional regulator [Haematobacter missouriensis]|uniref:LysR family transcriptional regulator n=1 Tax=Haematobacter missouriensis TaxID=366616 RepID=A0A212AKD6_9RHOB|nr:LysR family transcriptional regulator [Haematobacter missouriensis]KFI25996.1 LysR family transcriptional regulator [Haematobacter missouriensis]OWJ73709.1 LysR family transcriptional regulator [Haematobacter missouriensis]OWJ81962.1 LysR family transcriptional regulator [Haematobacter missouriensis]